MRKDVISCVGMLPGNIELIDRDIFSGVQKSFPEESYSYSPKSGLQSKMSFMPLQS